MKMKSKTNRMLSFWLTVGMLLLLIPFFGITASAADTVVNVSTYDELKTALENGGSQPDTVRLMADIDVNTPISVSLTKKYVNIDLNGYKLTYSSQYCFELANATESEECVQLRVCDTSAANSGLIKVSAADPLKAFIRSSAKNNAKKQVRVVFDNVTLIGDGCNSVVDAADAPKGFYAVTFTGKTLVRNFRKLTRGVTGCDAGEDYGHIWLGRMRAENVFQIGDTTDMKLTAADVILSEKYVLAVDTPFGSSSSHCSDACDNIAFYTFRDDTNISELNDTRELKNFSVAPNHIMDDPYNVSIDTDDYQGSWDFDEEDYPGADIVYRVYLYQFNDEVDNAYYYFARNNVPKEWCIGLQTFYTEEKNIDLRSYICHEEDNGFMQYYWKMDVVAVDRNLLYSDSKKSRYAFEAILSFRVPEDICDRITDENTYAANVLHDVSNIDEVLAGSQYTVGGCIVTKEQTAITEVTHYKSDTKYNSDYVYFDINETGYLHASPELEDYDHEHYYFVGWRIDKSKSDPYFSTAPVVLERYFITNCDSPDTTFNLRGKKLTGTGEYGKRVAFYALYLKKESITSIDITDVQKPQMGGQAWSSEVTVSDSDKCTATLYSWWLDGVGVFRCIDDSLVLNPTRKFIGGKKYIATFAITPTKQYKIDKNETTVTIAGMENVKFSEERNGVYYYTGEYTIPESLLTGTVSIYNNVQAGSKAYLYATGDVDKLHRGILKNSEGLIFQPSYKWEVISNDAVDGWQPVSTSDTYTPTDSQIGWKLRVSISVQNGTNYGYGGTITSAAVTIGKRTQDGMAEAPNLSEWKVGDEYIGFRILNYNPDQEYIWRSSVAKNTSTLDWTLNPIVTTGSVATISADAGKTYYVYTRIKETKTYGPGSQIVSEKVRLSDNVSLEYIYLEDSDGNQYRSGDEIWMSDESGIMNYTIKYYPEDANVYEDHIWSVEQYYDESGTYHRHWYCEALGYAPDMPNGWALDSRKYPSSYSFPAGFKVTQTDTLPRTLRIVPKAIDTVYHGSGVKMYVSTLATCGQGEGLENFYAQFDFRIYDADGNTKPGVLGIGNKPEFPNVNIIKKEIYTPDMSAVTLESLNLYPADAIDLNENTLAWAVARQGTDGNIIYGVYNGYLTLPIYQLEDAYIGNVEGASDTTDAPDYMKKVYLILIKKKDLQTLYNKCTSMNKVFDYSSAVNGIQIISSYNVEVSEIHAEGLEFTCGDEITISPGKTVDIAVRATPSNHTDTSLKVEFSCPLTDDGYGSTGIMMLDAWEDSDDHTWWRERYQNDTGIFGMTIMANRRPINMEDLSLAAGSVTARLINNGHTVATKTLKVNWEWGYNTLTVKDGFVTGRTVGSPEEEDTPEMTRLLEEAAPRGVSYTENGKDYFLTFEPEVYVTIAPDESLGRFKQWRVISGEESDYIGGGVVYKKSDWYLSGGDYGSDETDGIIPYPEIAVMIQGTDIVLQAEYYNNIYDVNVDMGSDGTVINTSADWTVVTSGYNADTRTYIVTIKAAEGLAFAKGCTFTINGMPAKLEGDDDNKLNAISKAGAKIPLSLTLPEPEATYLVSGTVTSSDTRSSWIYAFPYSMSTAEIKETLNDASVLRYLLKASTGPVIKQTDGSYKQTFEFSDTRALRNGEYKLVAVKGTDEYAIKGISVSDADVTGVDIVFAGGATVSGTFTSFGDATKETTIQLIPQDGSAAPAPVKVTGNSGTYIISNVASGTYTMQVMKTKHCTREYTVTVGSSDVTQNVEIRLLGDVNGDGAVLTNDANEIVKYYSGKASLLSTGNAENDAYTQKVADVNGDGSALTNDANEIVKYNNGKPSVLG